MASVVLVPRGHGLVLAPRGCALNVSVPHHRHRHPVDVKHPGRVRPCHIMDRQRWARGSQVRRWQCGMCVLHAAVARWRGPARAWLAGRERAGFVPEASSAGARARSAVSVRGWGQERQPFYTDTLQDRRSLARITALA
jgi:hypothetical protein